MADDGTIDDAAAERLEDLALRGVGKAVAAAEEASEANEGVAPASDAGIEMNGEGFARLDQVFQWPRIRSLKPTLAEIQKVERDNAKKRFTLKPGHSIELASEALHAPITLEAANVPAVVVHGTYFAFWPAIVESGGLKKMGRTHVHFGTGLPEDGSGGGGEGEGGKPKVISGMRADAEILVFVDVEASLRNGDMKWWLSSNNVVLTEGDENGCVPLQYFKEVRGRRQEVGLLWKDGEKLADLPEGITIRTPQGKDRQGGGRGR
ncbi:hypothetical protein PG994_012336 [Apiospora phragmitis]|uniref:2'-phosphotransferase n=1 Tax=Apiospora phragmitis TaxID=2905665 RepID=A0ABR1TVD5_9PEZI